MEHDEAVILEPICNTSTSGWMPIEGAETRSFLERAVPPDSRSQVLQDAVEILTRGAAPDDDQFRETGLVVGYVQSGKTMSFEAVAALACDNEFELIIVIAGASNPLLNQSTDRLRRDLRIEGLDGPRHWKLVTNPSVDDETVGTMRAILESWRDPTIPRAYKRTILVTVLKNHRRIESLTQLLQSLDLGHASVLVIDDEADQASLNSEVSRGDESTTYRRIMELKATLAKCTYLQYTATPQAPLLVNIVDSLSPTFVQVLVPGDQYVGGQHLFGDDLSFVREIPPDEVPTQENVLYEPPGTLLDALRVFMVGLAVELGKGESASIRSMLVHPSYRTAQQQEYASWIREVFATWKSLLALPDTDPDKEELLDDFRFAFDDLAGTVGESIPAFVEIAPLLRVAFLNTSILEVNAREGQTPAVDWNSAYGWILVGGQAIDRGFTVEGLTVTYMPRGIGIGNADTVQQRARFFGYKRSYLGYCRIYLEAGTRDAFRAYVEHEEDIHRQLREIQSSGRSLKEWKRAFFLDSRLRPCRASVLDFDYMRGRFADSWVVPRVVRTPDELIQGNRSTVVELLRNLSFDDDEGHPDRTDIQRHEVCRDVTLKDALDRLLLMMSVVGSGDSQRNTGMLLQLSRAIEDDLTESCTIYRMSPAVPRHRGLRGDGEITNLFQGPYPVKPRRIQGSIYPGDAGVRDDDSVTVQIHVIQLTDDDNEVIVRDVPVLAVWIPARLAASWIVQA